MTAHRLTPAGPASADAAVLLAGMLRDAVGLAQRGVADPSDIDTAMRLGAGHPVGPFQLMAELASNEWTAVGAVQTTAPTHVQLAPSEPERPWRAAVGVAGSGHMAAGITEAVARSGRPVRVLTRTTAAGQALRERVAASLERSLVRGRIDAAACAEALSRVQSTNLAEDLADVDVVIEAVAEDIDIKAAVLSRLDAALPGRVPLATNTSSFQVADLRPHLAAERPVLALHFFNPAPAMRLIEVVVPDDAQDAPELRAAALDWVRELRKTPITCADTRGFVVNRLLIPYLNDAVRLHASGVAPEEVDELMRDGASHPMGPLALIDLIGLDVTIAALESLAGVEDDERLVPAPLLRELAACGRLGRKSGAGFFEYA